ncbi:unnamed protein product [Urochloa humidicola]
MLEFCCSRDGKPACKYDEVVGAPTAAAAAPMQLPTSNLAQATDLPREELAPDGVAPCGPAADVQPSPSWRATWRAETLLTREMGIPGTRWHAPSSVLHAHSACRLHVDTLTLRGSHSPSPMRHRRLD